MKSPQIRLELIPCCEFVGFFFVRNGMCVCNQPRQSQVKEKYIQHTALPWDHVV